MRGKVKRAGRGWDKWIECLECQSQYSMLLVVVVLGAEEEALKRAGKELDTQITSLYASRSANQQVWV